MLTRSLNKKFKPKFLRDSFVDIISSPVVHKEPWIAKQALQLLEWRDARTSEYKALLKNTWDLVPLHPSQNLVGKK